MGDDKTNNLSHVIVRGGATGFGLFDTGFGVAWFLGSWVMGILYEKSILILVIFSVVLQLLSLLAFALAKRAD